MKTFNRSVALGGSERKIGAEQVNVLLYDTNDKVLYATGTTVPTSATAGYAKGCLFVDTDVTAGTKALYENIGSTSSCNFNLIGDIVASEIAIANTKILIGNGSGVAVAYALSGDVTMTNAGVVTVANDAITEAKVADSDGTGGLYIKKTALAVYDFSVDGGAQGAVVLADSATIPDNAVVTAVSYDVLTTCTSSTDASTISLTLPTDGALTTAIAISDGSNPWDAGVQSALTGGGAFGTAPTTLKTTGARAIGITIAGGEDLTAGKIVFAVEYWVSQ